MAHGGLAVPLAISFAGLTLLAILLLCPKPIHTPAVYLAKVSTGQNGSIVLYTACVGLLLLLASPMYETFLLWHRDGLTESERDEQEASTMLSIFLNVTNLLLLFVLRKLGMTLAEIDRRDLSEAALLKQVTGLRQEYDRITSEAKPNAADTTDSATSGADQHLEQLQQQLAQAQAAAEAAEKSKAAAEANAAALRSQAKGLENEYDRLLAEHDQLKAKLAKAIPGAVPVGGNTWADKKGA